MACILTFNEGTPNISAEVNDLVYYVSSVAYQWQDMYMASDDEAATGVSTHIFIGHITAVVENDPPGGFTITTEEPSNMTIVPPTENDYIFIVKNNRAETSTMKGYYSKVTMNNNSTTKAELYAVSAEVTESSK